MAIEVELKTQIPGKDWLLQKLGTDCKFITHDKQINSYFFSPEKGVLAKLGEKLSVDSQQQFIDLLKFGKKYSIRTRCEYTNTSNDGRVTLYIKYAIDDTTSENGVRRQEFAKPVSITIEALNEILIACGLTVQACWSRQRWSYSYKNMAVAIDFNAGYGWLAEFEIEAQTPSEANVAEAEIRKLLTELEIKVIDPAKLERMFSYYNAHWRDYYLTDKIFDSSKM